MELGKMAFASFKIADSLSYLALKCPSKSFPT